MSLLEKIKADQLVARKARNAVIANLLGVVIATCDTEAKKGKTARSLTDNEIVAIIKNTLKQNGEALTILGNTERADEIAKLNQERTQLETYLPQQLSDEEVTDIAIRQHSLGLNLGQIMAHLKAEYAGRYDGQKASQIVKGVCLPS